MEKNKDPGDNKMPQGWLFMSNYLSLIRRTAAILIFSLSSSLFTVPNIWIIINFDFMEQQHCQRLPDTSYLGRAHALHIALILRLPKNKLKKRKERKSLDCFPPSLCLGARIKPAAHSPHPCRFHSWKVTGESTKCLRQLQAWEFLQPRCPFNFQTWSQAL